MDKLDGKLARILMDYFAEKIETPEAISAIKELFENDRERLSEMINETVKAGICKDCNGSGNIIVMDGTLMLGTIKCIKCKGMGKAGKDKEIEEAIEAIEEILSDDEPFKYSFNEPWVRKYLKIVVDYMSRMKE